MKNCTICRKYPKAKSSYYCKKCHANYQAKYAKRTGYKDSKKRSIKLRDLIKSLKNVPCSDCSLRYPWYVMDFDHVRGEKSFNLSTAAAKRLSETRILKEVTKCEVVCANCHRERTFKRSGVA